MVNVPHVMLAWHGVRLRNASPRSAIFTLTANHSLMSIDHLH
jgi:hypothetical protein